MTLEPMDTSRPSLIDADTRPRVLNNSARIAELKALLRDIEMGADMMLEPALGLRGAVLSYVQEVKRVAKAGREV